MSGITSRAFTTLLTARRIIERAQVDRFAGAHPRLASALRSVYRPAYRMLAPNALVTGERDGLRLSADARQRDLALLLLGGGPWEERQTQLIQSLLSEGMVFVDVGSHIGLYTLLAARRVGPSGRVYAFEPAPDNIRLLRHNVAQNGFGNVTAEFLAVSSEKGTARFTLSSKDSASHSLSPAVGGRQIEVETTSLDEYFSSLDVSIDVLKIDAEGAEPQILAGMQQTLARNPSMIIFAEFYPRAIEALGNSAEQFLSHLTDLGFELAPITEDCADIAPLRRENFADFCAALRATGGAVNLLARRRPAAVSVRGQRLDASASTGQIPAREPLISVAIPTYQRCALLEKTLESLLPQLGDFAEIVVYDTGSTDGTPGMLTRLATTHQNVRFFSIPELCSLDETLLLLLKEARGEYVWFFSSDDRLKPGALAAARRAILSAARPALIYLNQEITDEAGRRLIRSQVGSTRNRVFTDGRRIVPFLGLNLGFISATLVRRDAARLADSTAEFVGTRSLNLHLILGCLLTGGSAFYLGTPWIAARRESGAPPYEYRDVFVRHIARIFSDARLHGFPPFLIFRAMHRTVAGTYLRLVVSWRIDDPAELARTFPEMWRACWVYPAFWLLVLPARWAPRKFLRIVRDGLRQRRARRVARETAKLFPLISERAMKSLLSDMSLGDR